MGTWGLVLFCSNQSPSDISADFTPLHRHKQSALPNRPGSTSSKSLEFQTRPLHQPLYFLTDTTASQTNLLLGRLLLYFNLPSTSPPTATTSLHLRHSSMAPSLNDSRTRGRKVKVFFIKQHLSSCDWGGCRGHASWFDA
jgi:hypothetical protein